MKVLVTGATGQLGKALMASAPAAHELVVPGRKHLDLADARAITSFVERERPDIVINAGAYTAVDRAEEERALAYSINAEAVGAFADALSRYRGRLVTVSTDFVFDGTSPRAYRPEDPPNPVSIYGQSKAAGEKLAGGDALIVRTAWVHSSGGANFVTTMLRLMREREALSVVCDQIGAPSWAPALSRAIWGLVEISAKGIFHHSDAGVASWYDFAIAIQEEALELGLLDRAIPITPIPSSAYPTPATRPAFSLLDSSATREALREDAVHWRTNLRYMLQEQKALTDWDNAHRCAKL